LRRRLGGRRRGDCQKNRDGSSEFGHGGQYRSPMRGEQPPPI
jgi:hypothetical protein